MRAKDNAMDLYKELGKWNRVWMYFKTSKNELVRWVEDRVVWIEDHTVRYRNKNRPDILVDFEYNRLAPEGQLDNWIKN